MWLIIVTFAVSFLIAFSVGLLIGLSIVFYNKRTFFKKLKVDEPQRNHKNVDNIRNPLLYPNLLTQSDKVSLHNVNCIK